MLVHAATLLLLLSVPAATVAAGGGLHPPWEAAGHVLSAADGDTLTVATAEHGRVVARLAGVDTPERGQAYWRSARRALSDATAAGVMLTCYKTDRYGREVCRARTPTGVDIAAQLLAAGLAWHYRQFQAEQTDAERTQYADLEQRARERRIGLWSQPDPMDPAECRRSHRTGGDACR